VNERKLPKLNSRKKDIIKTEEKWKDGKVFRPQQHGYEAVEVSDAVEEEGSSPIATTSFTHMCYLLTHKFLPHSTITALTAASGLWVEVLDCHSQQ